MQRPIETRFCPLSRYSHALAPALFAFMLGALGPDVFPGAGGGMALAALITLVVLAVLIGFRARPWCARAGLWLVALALGACYAQWRASPLGPYDISRFAPLPQAWVQGVVERRDPAQGRATLRVLSVNGQYADGRLQVRTTRQALPAYGSVVWLRGELLLPWRAWFPGGYDARRYLQHAGLSALMRRVQDIRITRTAPLTLHDTAMRWLEAVRDRILTTFQGALSSRQANTLGGMVLGSHASGIDPHTKQQFINTGLIHLLAASGMNVGIIAGCLLALARWGRCPSRGAILLAMLGVGGYMGLAGMAPSVTRAGVMLLLALGFKLADRQLSAVTLLALAVGVMTLWDPRVVSHVGFQLSVLSTLGLLAMVPPLHERLSYYVPRWLSMAILGPVVAQAWVMPISVYYFNQAPLHSVVLNMLAALLVVPLTVMGFFAALATLVWPPAGHMLAGLSAPLINALLGIVEAGNQLNPWALLTPASPPLWLVLGLYALLVGLSVVWAFRLRVQPWRVALTLGALAILAVSPFAWERWQATRLTRLDWTPLSPTAVALLVSPPADAPPWLILPQALRVGEGRTLDTFLRKRGIHHLAWMITPPPATTRVGKAGLLAALRARHADRVGAVSPTAQGPLLQTGSVHLDTTPHAWIVRMGQACFELSLPEAGWAASSAKPLAAACPVGGRLSSHEPATLWLGPTRRAFPPGQWHRVELSSQQATVY